MGDRHAPCGTPVCSLKVWPLCCPSLIVAVLLSRNEHSVLVKHTCRSIVAILYLSPLCQTLSNAFETSRSTMSILCPVFVSREIVSCSRASAVWVPR